MTRFLICILLLTFMARCMTPEPDARLFKELVTKEGR